MPLRLGDNPRVTAYTVALVLAAFQGGGPGYVPVVQGGKWGFINQQGRLVIPAQFDGARGFEGPLAAAKQGTKWGFINAFGAWVVAPEYDVVGDFSEGAAAVLAGDRIGFVNSSGQFLIRPRFPAAFHDPGQLPAFKQGLAGVYVESGANAFGWRYIDFAGNDAFPAVFATGSDFSEGVAAVAVSAGSWGYVNRDGEFVIEPKFEYAGPFRNGLAAVVKDKKMGYIGKSGAFVIPNRFEEALDFSEGLALVRENGKYMVIDTEGKQAFAKTFVEVDPLAMEVFRFSEGMLVFIEQRDNGEFSWGYVDRAGRVAIRPKFDFGGLFKNGIAPVTVRKGDDLLHGYIDKSGRYVWEPSK